MPNSSKRSSSSPASSPGSSATLPGEKAPSQVDDEGAPQQTKHQMARWCRVTTSADGDIGYDIDARIVNLNTIAPSDEIIDRIHGETINSQIWPLIFNGSESIDEDNRSTTYLRSLAHMRHLLAGDTSTSWARFEGLSVSNQRAVALGVRDLYLAGWRGLLDSDDDALLRNITNFLARPVDLDSHLRPCDERKHCITIKNLPVSFHPSRNFKMLRFIEDIDQYIPEEHRSLTPHFAEILLKPRIHAVFVNPTDISYHNFENIVPLDPWLMSVTAGLPIASNQLDEKTSVSREPSEKNQMLPLALIDTQRLERSAQVWTSKLALATSFNNGSLSLNNFLLELADLNLFVPPLNASTRGGERFIFHSNFLSRSLTRAIRESGVLEYLPVPTASFRFTNYVFRLNRFRPDDHKFSCHRDTPYYDAARGHVSRYTLLMYLTGGTSMHSTDEAAVGGIAQDEGCPILRIKSLDGEDVVIHSIQPMQCIIFDQRLEHEGHPFVEGDKVFLRTELIFDVNDSHTSELGNTATVTHDPTVGELFAQACYYTSMAATTMPEMNDGTQEAQVFQEELSRHAHECYEKVNGMHWGSQPTKTRVIGKSDADEPRDAREHGEGREGMESSLYLFKNFSGLRFVTNGVHYWFAKGNRPRDGVGYSAQGKTDHLKSCALAAVLDYFNCRLDGTAFRQSCQVAPIRRRMNSDGDIWQILMNREAPRSTSDDQRLRALKPIDLDNLLKRKPYKPFVRRECSWMDEDERNEEEPLVQETGAACCPFHDYQNFDAWDSIDVYDDIYTPCCEYTRRKILSSPFVFLDEEVVVNEKQFLVEGDKIYILRDDKLHVKAEEEGKEGIDQEPLYGRGVHGRINFAACWNSIPPTAFIGLDREIGAPQLLVPPMQFHDVDKGEDGGYYHLMLDFFKNDWVVDFDGQHRIPVPVITNDIGEDVEEEDDGGSEFLRKLPGIRREFGRPMEIMSEDERRIEDEKFNARRGGRRSGRRQPHLTLAENVDSEAEAEVGKDGDNDLVEIDDDEWGTESEAEATDEEQDDRRRRRRQEWLSIDTEVDLDDEDLDEESPDEVQGRSDRSDSDVVPRKKQRRV